MDTSRVPDLTHPEGLQSLSSIAHFLRSEGFYAAEAALLREIESRFPAAVRQPSGSLSDADAPATASPRGDASHGPINSARSSDVVLLAEPISAGDRQRHCRPPAISPANSGRSSRGTSASRQSPLSGPQKRRHAQAGAGGVQGEHSDDDDVGYVAVPIPRQDNFIMSELRHSDDDGSPSRSGFGYHRYRPRTPDEASWGGSCPPVSSRSGGADSGDGSGGSSGAGSSFFSGEPQPNSDLDDLSRTTSGGLDLTLGPPRSCNVNILSLDGGRSSPEDMSRTASGASTAQDLGLTFGAAMFGAAAIPGSGSAYSPRWDSSGGRPVQLLHSGADAQASSGTSSSAGRFPQLPPMASSGLLAPAAVATLDLSGSEPAQPASPDGAALPPAAGGDRDGVFDGHAAAAAELPASERAQPNENRHRWATPHIGSLSELQAHEHLHTEAAANVTAGEDDAGSVASLELPGATQLSATAAPAASDAAPSLANSLHTDAAQPLKQLSEVFPTLDLPGAVQQPQNRTEPQSVPALQLFQPPLPASQPESPPRRLLIPGISPATSASKPDKRDSQQRRSLEASLQHHRRLDPLTRPTTLPLFVLPPMRLPNAAAASAASPASPAVATDFEEVDVLIGDSVSAQASPTHEEKDHARLSLAAQQQQQSTVASKSLSYLDPRHVIGRVADVLHLHRSGSGSGRNDRGSSGRSRKQDTQNSRSSATSGSDGASSSGARMPTLDGGTVSGAAMGRGDAGDDSALDSALRGGKESPQTPTAAMGAGGEGAAFSFPVTPPSDPPPPPQAVFKGWNSFKDSLQRRRSDGMCGSSECSGTDDELAVERSRASTPNSGPPTDRPSALAGLVSSERASSSAPPSRRIRIESPAPPPQPQQQAGRDSLQAEEQMRDGSGGSLQSKSARRRISTASCSLELPSQQMERQASVRASSVDEDHGGRNALTAAAMRTGRRQLSNLRAEGMATAAERPSDSHATGRPDLNPSAAAVQDAAQLDSAQQLHHVQLSPPPPQRPSSFLHKFSSLSLMPSELEDAGFLVPTADAGAARSADVPAAAAGAATGESNGVVQHGRTGSSGATSDDSGWQLPVAVDSLPPGGTQPATPPVSEAGASEAADFDVLPLRVIHRRRATGFEDVKELPIQPGDTIAGRYQVMDFLGSAAFSRAVQARDLQTGSRVCLKVVKNNKDYFDQSLDEIKLLRYVNAADPDDKAGILRLYDYFYFREHLILVCELLRANLFELQRFTRLKGEAPYFTLDRTRSIAHQVLRSLAFLHGLNLIHADLKPENVLIKSYSRCEVKVIDLGSSLFTSDVLSSYVQSRAYRSPEVILGLPYGQAIDIWSLGCILAELLSGHVLFQNSGVASLLARMEGVLGPLPAWMLEKGRYAHRFYTRGGALYQHCAQTGQYQILRPKISSLRARIGPAVQADDACVDFLEKLLTIDPSMRPSAAQALDHPWLVEAGN